MSHQLKLNALQFSSSLENEKSLLQNSQDVLERELPGGPHHIADSYRKPGWHTQVQGQPRSGIAQGTQHNVHAAWHHGHCVHHLCVDIHAYQVYVEHAHYAYLTSRLAAHKCKFKVTNIQGLQFLNLLYSSRLNLDMALRRGPMR